MFASATHVFCDSRAARLLAEYGASSSRTRHIHRRWHFTRFHVDEGDVYIASQRGAANPANGLTKMTLGWLFVKERAYMLGVSGREPWGLPSRARRYCLQPVSSIILTTTWPVAEGYPCGACCRMQASRRWLCVVRFCSSAGCTPALCE